MGPLILGIFQSRSPSQSFEATAAHDKEFSPEVSTAKGTVNLNSDRQQWSRQTSAKEEDTDQCGGDSSLRSNANVGHQVGCTYQEIYQT